MTPPDTPNKQPGANTSLASRNIQPRFTGLVQDCRKLLMNRLAELLAEVFSKVDDALFECAGKVDDNQIQALFFDNMRNIRRLRPQIERVYHQQIAQNFSAFMAGKPKHPGAPTQPKSDELALVKHEDYEESIQLTNMVNHVLVRAAQSIDTLNQRLALLNNGQKMLEGSTPFGPQAITEAFCAALAPHSLPLQVKTILYTLFDRHVMHGLDAIYAALNQLLIEAGVLPTLKYSARSQTAKPRHAPNANERSVSSAQTSADSTHATRATPPVNQWPPQAGSSPLDSGEAQSDRAELFGKLSALMTEGRRQGENSQLPDGTPSISSFAPSGATRTYSANELLDALNRLQAESANDLVQRLQQPQRVLSLKESLQQQLETHSRSPGKLKLADHEADVIDLVGMLFDFILDDENLPDSCKTILSHLHTPYLKVALQDHALFTQPEHPARKLLNGMAQAGGLYDIEVDARGLLAKMRWVVERVIHHFAGDLLLFETLLDEFNEYVASLKRKVDLHERRTVEAAKGRDKLLGARQQAAAVIARVLRDRQPATMIRNFLEVTWIDVLVFVLLRHGISSQEWQRTSEVAEQLAWAGTILDADELQRLQGLRHALLEDLGKGLELLGGHHADGIRRVLQDIAACLHAVQARQPEISAKLNAKLPPSPLGAMLGEDVALMQAAPDTATLSSRAQALLKELEQVEFGTWFELLEKGQRRNLKLSWFSPATHNYVFVDSSGQRVAIKHVALLAMDMETGAARILPQKSNIPLVDRALTAIYRMLQRWTGRTTDENSY